MECDKFYVDTETENKLWGRSASIDDIVKMVCQVAIDFKPDRSDVLTFFHQFEFKRIIDFYFMIYKSY